MLLFYQYLKKSVEKMDEGAAVFLSFFFSFFFFQAQPQTHAAKALLLLQVTEDGERLDGAKQR